MDVFQDLVNSLSNYFYSCLVIWLLVGVGF